VALTHIRGAVGATLEEITWISTAFVIATVLVMPLTAFLGRLVGQKRLYMASLVLFLVGSALCGMARFLETLVIFRIIQGFGAGALQPTEQQRKNVDWSGITLLCVGLCALQYVLEEGQRNDWFDSRLIVALALVAVFATAAFVIRELTAKVPAVNLALFKDPVFLSGTL